MNKVCRDIIALGFVPGLGPCTINSMIEKAADTEDIFCMPDKYLSSVKRGHRIDPVLIKKSRETEEYCREIGYIEREHINVTCCKDSIYPGLLKEIYDPPPVIYHKGRITAQDMNAVAIVGSRKCSVYGLMMAERLASELAERGVTIISGMARGIDSAAHRGALRVGGRTIAVMGSGFRNIYPPEAGKFIDDIVSNGAVVTEFPSDTMPLKENFPRRNRIISGMSRAVVVVEAAKKSGAMITVDMALEQGKEVFAVPGHADLYTAEGSNRLIQSGAKLVMNADDILEELQTFEPEVISSELPQSEDETVPVSGSDKEMRMVLGSFENGLPVQIDHLYANSGIDTRMLPEVLLKMEIKGLIRSVPGGNYILK